MRGRNGKGHDMRTRVTCFLPGLALATLVWDLGPFHAFGMSVPLAANLPASGNPPAPGASYGSPVPGEGPFRLTEQEARCLARTVFFEARGESLRGKLSVALVALHRAQRPRFPDETCEVIHQTAAFSWYSDGKSNDPETYRGPANRRAWVTARRLVDNLRRGRLHDPTHGADHYHADYVSPDWSRYFPRTARIGQHLFYRRAR